MKINFLSTDEVLAIQERLIDRFGGTHGVRDPGILESALYRPQSGYYQDLAEMGAALFESLLMNHPFLDGNKRVAFFGTDVFLRINGYFMDVNDDEALIKSFKFQGQDKLYNFLHENPKLVTVLEQNIKAML